MGDDRIQLRALLEEARPHTDPAIITLLALILDQLDALRFPHESPTAPRPKAPDPIE